MTAPPSADTSTLRDEEGQRQRLLYSVSRRFADHETARLGGVLNHYLHWPEMRIYKEEAFRTYPDQAVLRTYAKNAVMRMYEKFSTFLRLEALSTI